MLKSVLVVFVSGVLMFVLPGASWAVCISDENCAEGFHCEFFDCICDDNASCDDGRFCNGMERCVPFELGNPEYGCMPALMPPCLLDLECDELQDRCITECDVNGDVDGDAFRSVACGGVDCNDNDVTIHPGAFEICDDIDQDCDPTRFANTDLDGDGNIDRACSNTDALGNVYRGDDCDDTRPDVSPDSPEDCNHRDDDCDGEIDEGVAVFRYPDRDGDGAGDWVSDAIQTCPDDTTTSPFNTDCDDENPFVRPGAPELCNQRDDDCDGAVDEGVAVLWYPDQDNDGHGDARAAAFPGCPGDRFVAAVNDDCDDEDPVNVPYVYQTCHPDDPTVVLMCIPGGVAFPRLAVQPCVEGAFCVPQPNGTGICEIAGPGRLHRPR